MPDSDIRVTGSSVRFRPVHLGQPLSISGRAISSFALAEVQVEVTNRAGQHARGRGMSMLSVPWAWPEAEIDATSRDRALRELTEELAAAIVGTGPSDPLALWRHLYGDLDARLVRLARRHGVPVVPRLAGLLPLGAVDNAVHDAWALAAGRPASAMYGADHLGGDLGWLDPALRGRYPGDFLGRPRRVLPVQHVVGVSDPLTPAEATAAERPLTEWLRAEGVRHLKIKVAGEEAEEDARRIVDVARLGRELSGDVHVAIDPNEGCADAAAAVHLLDEIHRLDPGVLPAVDYVEQPVPRGDSPRPCSLGRLADRVPVLLDEGFADLSVLPGLPGLGWSGVVIKAAKGHSLALLTNALAKAHGLPVAVQDLTAVSWALVHSARLVSQLDPTWLHLEYNSRQYAPAAATALAQHLPELALVTDGVVRLPDADGPGLYQLAAALEEDPS